MTAAYQGGKVAVLAGGNSAEREVSLRSGKAVMAALQENNVAVEWFDPAERSILELAKLNIEVAFIALHGRGGEDGEIQAVLNCLGIPFTGSKVLGCALAMDKSRTKQLWRGVGLPTADALTINALQCDNLDAEQVMAHMGGRVMVKPAREGSSIGMSVATSAAELREALHEAAKFDAELLIERWLSGPEYTVAVLGNEALPSIRVKTPHVFYDYVAKYENTSTEYICPAGLSDDMEQQLRTLAFNAFMAVGGQGWGRVDIMLDAAGQPQLLEVNMVPGMTAKSLVPMAAKQHGLSFSQLVMRILATATVD
ncbi:D-alanine--D-alanine ligase [Aliidiomarina quisquiliarum]|uniref:D-alanine--D-alanine ligase n=1 Tax=Aliidiomarina quisquiliarum TaxID=2938947 RepID=UPI00208F1D1E|nr:D-alanine--D-alanine ligase [Aliidiomarina quisquiliarum]MCO4321465.1 D-alanine--D-alanine ligase [Aliidiomarina quisquiliarum]